MPGFSAATADSLRTEQANYPADMGDAGASDRLALVRHQAPGRVQRESMDAKQPRSDSHLCTHELPIGLGAFGDVRPSTNWQRFRGIRVTTYDFMAVLVQALTQPVSSGPHLAPV
jgi:hypothetical protein